MQAVEQSLDPNSLWNGKPISRDIANQHESARGYADRECANDRYNPTRGDCPGVVLL
jgi:hypothetical protein